MKIKEVRAQVYLQCFLVNHIILLLCYNLITIYVDSCNCHISQNMHDYYQNLICQSVALKIMFWENEHKIIN